MAMISPASVEKSYSGKMAALKLVRPAPPQLAGDVWEWEQEPQSSPIPQLEALWHYECVVSPRSPASALKSHPASPRSPAARAADPTPAGYDHQPLLMAAPFSSAKPASHPPLAASAQLAAMSHHRSSPPSTPRSPAGAAAGGAGGSAPAPSPLSRFAPGQQALAKRVFNTFDENGDGIVSTEEIGRMFEKLGLSRAAPEGANSLTVTLLAGIPSFVTKTEGEVDEEEFVLLYEMACCFVQGQDEGAAAAAAEAADGSSSSESDSEDGAEEDLRAAFQVFDKDGNGYISPAELQSVLCSLGFEQARRLEACEDMIARVDENGDGHVDFFEFKKLFHMDNPFLAAIQTF